MNSPTISQLTKRQLFSLHVSPARRREWLAFLIFVSPNLIGVLLFTAVPVLVGLGLSFTNWNMLSDPKWVGLQNYRDLLDDDLFWIGLKNTVYYSLMVIPGNMIISLGLALALTSGLKGSRVYRTIFFLPYVSSAVAVALVWKWIMHPNFGVANSILEFFGLKGIGWFTDPSTALMSIAIVAIWQTAGYNMVLFMAGLNGIPRQLYEVAQLDGASGWRAFVHITLPLLMPTTFFVLITSLIGSFQVFTLVFNMTGGGPGNSTVVYVYQLWRNAFFYFKMGYASAMAYVLFLILLVITLLQVRLVGRRVNYDYV
jgi:multiple sugar transport system permease protein